ncbi:MAG: DUF1080 domain-containing protein [Dysgonomonas sp.]
MKKYFFFFLIVVFFASCGNVDEKHLLNDDSGWTLNEKAQIEDSILKLSGNSAIAQLDKEYKNFELTMECKTTHGAIAGIWLHSDAVDDKPQGGYEILINNNIENTDWRKTGSLSAIRNFGKRTVDNDTWFPIKIKVLGKQIKVYVNDVWVVDYTEPKHPYRTETYADRLLTEGDFLFYNYTDHPVLFRNMAIRPLADYLESDNPTDIDEQTDDIIRLQQVNYPLIDSHVHLKAGWTKEQAAAMSRKLGITYGIAPNCGLKFPVTSDADIATYIDTMQHTPFLLPMQAEGREWLTLFSEKAMSKFDYRFTDALTWTDNKGRRQRIWIKEETYVEDKQHFMDMLIDRACVIISTEPINIFVNPTFLPDELMDEYEELWTEKRMQRIIDACVRHNVALEINNRYKIPSARLIKQAKAAGVKFTFGTNNMDPNIGRMEYAIEMIKECDLKPENLYIPPSKNI